jgi:hypothetical protein
VLLCHAFEAVSVPLCSKLIRWWLCLTCSLHALTLLIPQSFTKMKFEAKECAAPYFNTIWSDPEIQEIYTSGITMLDGMHAAPSYIHRLIGERVLKGLIFNSVISEEVSV